MFCYLFFCIRHFSFSWLQNENTDTQLRLMISSRYFCARKYVYGTDTETMMLWWIHANTTPLTHIERSLDRTIAKWNEYSRIFFFFVFVSFHYFPFCVMLCVCTMRSELNEMEHTARSELKNLFWRCWMVFVSLAAIKRNVFIIVVSANTGYFLFYVFLFLFVHFIYHSAVK